MVYKKKAYWLTLAFILFASLVLRVFRLDTVPPSLNWDEVSHAYNSWSLSQTGLDQWGQVPVFNFRAYGDFPTTLNLYMTVPFVIFMGPTDFAVRLPHAIIGVLSILVGFIAAYRWSGNRWLALLVAALFAFSPWTLFPSRAIFQSNWTVFLLTVSLALFYTRSYQSYFLILGLSLFAYHNTRIFVPLLMLGMMFFPKIWRVKKNTIALLAVLLLAILSLWFSGARARGNWVGILDSGAIARLEELRNTTSLSPAVSRLVFNRVTYFTVKFADNYWRYFSPAFLFISGGTQYQYSLPGWGLIYPVFLPFFYIGLWFLVRRREYLLCLWLLLSPIPAAMTRDQSAVIRATAMIPVVFMVTSLGFMGIVSLVRKSMRQVMVFLFLLLFSLSLLLFMTEYFVRYSQQFSSSWQFGYSEVIKLAKTRYADYDRIIFTKKYGEPHEYVLWYWPWSPQKYLTNDKKWDFHADWYWVDSFDKFAFVNDWELGEYLRSQSSGKYLVVGSPESLDNNSDTINIKFLNDQPAFLIKDIVK